MPAKALKTYSTLRLDSIIFIQLAAALDTYVLPRVRSALHFIVYFAHDGVKSHQTYMNLTDASSEQTF